MKIAFITNGGLKEGMGHVYESITLAKELINEARIYFLTKSEEIVVEKIKNNGFEITEAEKDDKIIDQLKVIKPEVIIINLPKADERFIKDIRYNSDTKTKLVIFGNPLVNLPSNVDKYCDVIINPNPESSDFESKAFMDEDIGTLYLQGPRYLVLRQEFYNYKQKHQVKDKIKRILLIFGGEDPSNFTSKVLDKLLCLNYDFDINVVLGPAFIHDNKLNRVLNKHKNKNVKTYRNVNNIAELMYDADLVITSPGISMLESLCIGTPTIAIYQNPLQKKGWGYLRFTFDIGEIKDFEELIFSTHESFLKEGDNDIKQLDIGSGKAEIIKAITKNGRAEKRRK